jgi:membrane-associated phospholipid phosphatase
LFTCAALCGCQSLPHDRLWGRDVTASPGWSRFAAAAREAATDPWVWAPLAGAAVLQIDDADHRVSRWARDHRPVFGSVENATTWSDDLRDASAYAHYLTMLAARSGEGGQWWADKARGALGNASAVATTVAVTRTLKTSVERGRPSGTDRESFPSGHTSSAAVHARLASRTLEFTPLRPGARRALSAGMHTMMLGTAWARIEAGWHYPADTLAGMAIGRFIGSLFHDAFVDPRRPGSGWTVLIYPRADSNPKAVIPESP